MQLLCNSNKNGQSRTGTVSSSRFKAHAQRHPYESTRLRRAPDHQARLAQKQFSASANLLVQRLRWLLCVFGRTERGQISAARHRASAVPCTTSDPNMHRAVEWLIKTNSQASSSRATSTASDLSDEDRKENDYSLEHGFRPLSAYRTNAGDKLWRWPASIACDSLCSRGNRMPSSSFGRLPGGLHVEGGYTATNPFSTTNCWRACLVPLESERGTQNGFLPEQKAGLATGTAKGLRDHPAGDTESHTMRFFPGIGPTSVQFKGLVAPRVCV